MPPRFHCPSLSEQAGPELGVCRPLAVRESDVQDLPRERRERLSPPPRTLGQSSVQIVAHADRQAVRHAASVAGGGGLSRRPRGSRPLAAGGAWACAHAQASLFAPPAGRPAPSTNSSAEWDGMRPPARLEGASSRVNEEEGGVMAGMVLPERPEDQPVDVVRAMMELTGLDEGFVREHLAVMSAADATFAWERIRAHERSTGRSVSLPEDLPAELVREIVEFSGVGEVVVRGYLAVRNVMDAVGGWERFAPASAAEERLLRWRVRLAFGRPLPLWAERLIDEAGVVEGQRDRVRALVAAALALVGGGEAEARVWFAAPETDIGRAPMEILRDDGWEALDRLLVRAFDREGSG